MPAFSAAPSTGTPDGLRWARWCGLLLVVSYFLGVTSFLRILHVPASAWQLFNGMVLLSTAVLVVAGGGTWRWAWLATIVAFGASVFQAEQPGSSVLRWGGLVLLMIAAGPVVVNRRALAARALAWRVIVTGIPILTGIFVAWYFLRLPNFGAGHFSTFMHHCMLLGPVAGLGVGIAMTRALHTRSWRWGLLAILGLIPVLASGSRVATLSTMAALGFLMLRRKPALGLTFVAFLAVAVFAFLHQGRNLDTPQDSVTGALAYKGNENTRAALWRSRLEEFKASPYVGIGIAMGTGEGSLKGESGDIRVEPGSSYLAILAMTGSLGTLAFFGAVGILLFQFVHSRQAPVNRDTLYVFGAYMATHGIAEGWVLAFGSPLCFLFWIWLGNFADAALQPVPARVRRMANARPLVRRPAWALGHQAVLGH